MAKYKEPLNDYEEGFNEGFDDGYMTGFAELSDFVLKELMNAKEPFSEHLNKTLDELIKKVKAQGNRPMNESEKGE